MSFSSRASFWTGNLQVDSHLLIPEERLHHQVPLLPLAGNLLRLQLLQRRLLELAGHA